MIEIVALELILSVTIQSVGDKVVVVAPVRNSQLLIGNLRRPPTHNPLYDSTEGLVSASGRICINSGGAR